MTHLIRGTVISQAGALITELGGDADALLWEHGIDPLAIEDLNRFIRYEDAAAVLGHAARELDAPDFGLQVGGRQGIGSLGPLGMILRNAETVGKAVESVCHFLRHIAPADTALLTQTNASAVFSYSTLLNNAFDRQQMIEKAQALAMHAFRLMIAPTFTPKKVTFEHERLAPVEAYRRVFDCHVQFGQKQNAIHLAAGDLQRVIEDRDPMALTLAEDYLERMSPETAVVEHVRDVTRRLLMVDSASLRQVARALSVHERTLQRVLASHGTSFESILDDLRRTMAWELAATGMGAAQIARALGYGEQSSFSRACRRWFGQTPRDLLRRRRDRRPEEPPEGP